MTIEENIRQLMLTYDKANAELALRLCRGQGLCLYEVVTGRRYKGKKWEGFEEDFAKMYHFKFLKYPSKPWQDAVYWTSHFSISGLRAKLPYIMERLYGKKCYWSRVDERWNQSHIVRYHLQRLGLVK